MLLPLTDFHNCVLSTVIYWLHQPAVHYCCRDMQKSAIMPLKNQCRHYVSKKMCSILLTHIRKHVWLYYLPCNTFCFFMLELVSKLCLFKRLHNMTSIKAFFAFVSLNRYSTHTKQPQHSCVRVCVCGRSLLKKRNSYPSVSIQRS